MDKKLIGECIRHHRKAANLTQVDLAEALNVSVNIISKYERGITAPDRDHLFELSLILDFSIDRLIRDCNYFGNSTIPAEVAEIFDKLSVSQRKIAITTLKAMAQAMLKQ